MRFSAPALLLSALLSFNAQAAPETDGIHNESEVGVVMTGGNTSTENYNVRQLNSYGWGANMFKLNGRYLKGFAQKRETTRYWTLGLRFERALNARIGYFLGYSIESDIFAGYNPRHNGDIGGRVVIFALEDFTWNAELGYRFMNEHRTAKNETKTFHLGRLYTEAEKKWTSTFSNKLWVEYLPNFTDTRDYMINGELSASAAINSVFSLKAAGLLRYRNVPAQASAVPLDRTFTLGVLAKI